MINPNQKARILRKNLNRNNKYLLAKINDSGQETKNRKVLGRCFRYKDYVHEPEWIEASEKERWSKKFLGINDSGFKNLKHQNPEYPAAYNLKRRLEKFTKVFTFQIAGCNYACNYCYVPRKLNSGNRKYGDFLNAEEIVNEFLKIKKDSKEPMNVIRISGGECMIIPEIIIDVYGEMMKKSPDSYLWIDTNLSTIEIIKDHKKKLGNVLSQKNVGVVGCFKGTTKKDFSLITGAGEEFYREQFEVAKILIDLGADFYVYLPAYIYDKKTAEGKLESFLLELQKIHKNLPLRLEMFEIEDFPAAKINFEIAEKEGRAVPKTPQKLVFDLWYEKILPKYYPADELKKFCCEVGL